MQSSASPPISACSRAVLRFRCAAFRRSPPATSRFRCTAARCVSLFFSACIAFPLVRVSAHAVLLAPRFRLSAPSAFCNYVVSSPHSSVLRVSASSPPRARFLMYSSSPRFRSSAVRFRSSGLATRLRRLLPLLAPRFRSRLAAAAAPFRSRHPGRLCGRLPCEGVRLVIPPDVLFCREFPFDVSG